MTNAVDHMLAEIRKLAPEIPSRAAEIETARRMPPDLVDKLKEIGLYRMFVPRSHGGLELDFPEGVRVTAELGKIEGSLGWTAMIAMGSGLVTSLLPLESYNRVYENGPDVTLAGSAGDDGPPLVRGFILPASEWQIEDTWHVAGLKGTGSNHIAIANKFVPETSFFNIENAVPCVPGPLYQAPLDFLPMTHSAFAIGAAQGAVNELVELANTGRRQLRAATAMRDSEMFQGELGRAEADLRAAQALLEVQAASHWRHALAGTIKDGALGMQSTQTAVWISSTYVRVADACFALAGGSALYNASPLQRRLRDIHVGAQHASVQQRQYAAIGKLRLDVDSNAAAH
jgi:indole-3-acetate monooxygenase